MSDCFNNSYVQSRAHLIARVKDAADFFCDKTKTVEKAMCKGELSKEYYNGKEALFISKYPFPVMSRNSVS